MADPSGIPQLVLGFAVIAVSMTPGSLQALISGVANTIADFHAAVGLIPVQPQKPVRYRVSPVARLGFVVAGLCMIGLGIFAIL